jgi:hypothetical protein
LRRSELAGENRRGSQQKPRLLVTETQPVRREES